MNRFTALLKREWLEARFTYLAATLGLVALISFSGALATFVATLSEGGVVMVIERMDDSGNVERHERITDRVSSMADFSSWTDRELSQRLTKLRTAIASGFHVVFFFVVVFILLGCLFDERRDRSVLFWKSMPVSDQLTIASKLLMPVWLAPLIVIAAITATWILGLLLLSAITVAEDLGSVSRLWLQSGILGGFFQELIGYLIQGFWALPLYSWLILVSAIANRLPLLWAVLVPLVPIICEGIIFDTSHIGSFIMRHVEFAALPRTINTDDRQTQMVQSIGDQLSLLTTLDLWLGVIVGIALLAGAVWCHRRNNEQL